MAKTKLWKRNYNRVKRYVSRWTQKGLRWSETFLQSLSSKTTGQLKALTPSKLASEATALSRQTGEIISGTESQKELRSMSAKKGWETRRTKAEYGESANQGEIILERLIQMCDSFPTLGATFLRNLINSEISTYGRTKFVLALSQLDERIVAEADTLVHYDSGDRDKAIYQYNKIVNLIRGTMATKTEAKETGEIMDTMEVMEEEIYE